MIALKPAGPHDASTILDIQRQAFSALLEKYHDYDTNPAAEPLDHIQWKLDSPERDYWFILHEDQPLGLICVKRLSDALCISPIGLIPKYQGKGIGRQAVELLERQYPDCSCWRLGTILQESGLCRFYGGLGYRRTEEQTQIQPGMDLVGYEKIIERQKG